jgi:DNA-binding transcriptional MocR family regulator
VLLSIATALRDDIQAGWLTSMVELAHADTYADYLGMAEGLVSQGYKDAAAVIAGTSLEVHLKALASKHDIDLQMPNGRQKMASGLNDDLKRQDVYKALEHKQVTAWLAIRNSAAHGDYDDYDEAAVKGLIEGVRNFAIRHPA